MIDYIKGEIADLAPAPGKEKTQHQRLTRSLR